MLWWFTSAGAVVRSKVASCLRRTGSLCFGPVIGISSSVSSDRIADSRYWAPMKVVAVPVVDPECRGEVDAGVECRDDVLHHVFLGEPQVRRLDAVHVDPDLGVVQLLLDAHVNRAGHL